MFNPILANLFTEPVGVSHYVLVGAFMFTCGVLCMATKRNALGILMGIEMVLKGFLEVLEKHGVTQISAKGEPFDPQKHEAFAQVESKDHQPNSVVQELHKGYFMFDRLLRPSLVSVAKLPEAKEESSEQTKIEKNETDD